MVLVKNIEVTMIKKRYVNMKIYLDGKKILYFIIFLFDNNSVTHTHTHTHTHTMIKSNDIYINKRQGLVRNQA
jgi:hypothetical protein